MKAEAECNEHEVAEVTSVVSDEENVSKYAARLQMIALIKYGPDDQP
jgi:hypothetical protein